MSLSTRTGSSLELSWSLFKALCTGKATILWGEKAGSGEMVDLWDLFLGRRPEREGSKGESRRWRDRREERLMGLRISGSAQSTERFTVLPAEAEMGGQEGSPHPPAL